jgi:hypothetical protein
MRQQPRRHSIGAWARAVLLGAILVAAWIGCKNSADVTISGTIGGLTPEDTVFVTLSKDWERQRVPPISFDINPDGRFALRTTIATRPPPITFVKNGQLLAHGIRAFMHSLG